MAFKGRVFFFSDETGQKSGGRFFLVAGVAIEAYVAETRKMLVEAENRRDGIDGFDWHGTKKPTAKRNYLDTTFGISHLRGRLFFSAREGSRDYWNNTMRTINAAVQHYGTDKYCVIAHEGFGSRTRYRMRKELARRTNIEVRTGSFKKEPLVRLADRLAGALAFMKYSESPVRTLLDGLPFEDVVDLSGQ